MMNFEGRKERRPSFGVGSYTGFSSGPPGHARQATVKQIKAFRDGTRKDPSMQPMVANLSDEDIENLAAYYSSLK